MVCIYCQSPLAVSNSRPQKSRNQTWRRRPCKNCGALFSSTEALNLSQAISVDYGQTTESHNSTGPVRPLAPFDRDKLFISLYGSLRHRPTAIADARGLCDTATAHIISQAKNGCVNVRTITSTALNTLLRFDNAAATHYAAYHTQK